MKKNAGRLSKKLFAAMMAGTLMTAMMGMTVSAKGVVSGTGIESVNVKKIVTTDGNTYAPNTSFEFTVANGAAGTFDDGANESVSVKAGVTDGLKFGVAATFTPDTDESTASRYEGNATLTVDVSKFNGAGVYHYIVTEQREAYEGITYSEESYDVYVYVYNGTNGLYVGNVVSAQNGTKKDLTFTNNYGSGDNDSTHDVIIKKSVTGNQGDKNEKFTFVVGVNGGEGEVYKVVTTIDGSATTTYVESGKTITVQNVTDSDTIHIYGLSATDKYTVKETEANQNGYTTTYSDTDVTTADGATVTTDGTEMTVTNDRDASTPTGIAMTYGPYALMVALAGGMAALFLRRRNREDY